MKPFSLAICIGLAVVIGGCATTGGTTPSERRQAIQSMKNQVLTELYQAKPDVKSQIASAPGYAVFSNANVNLVLASFGGGFGVARNNKTGTDTYMKMGEVGVGLGLGIKDFRVVFVFHTDKSLNNFIENGWAVGAQADAAAKASDKGAAVGGEITADNITIYQLTETGLALQATIKGTKYWKDETLN
ncbi:MAG: YSC84-related protein [Gammaproteobacteria bacterium]|nr:YSC84-related protein [Gammaproteobacteria bacterium]MDH3448967.1 YSC84-related protein [Gammaproteobacteria bacterium]